MGWFAALVPACVWWPTIASLCNTAATKWAVRLVLDTNTRSGCRWHSAAKSQNEGSASPFSIVPRRLHHDSAAEGGEASGRFAEGKVCILFLFTGHSSPPFLPDSLKVRVTLQPTAPDLALAPLLHHHMPAGGLLYWCGIGQLIPPSCPCCCFSRC